MTKSTQTGTLRGSLLAALLLSAPALAAPSTSRVTAPKVAVASVAAPEVAAEVGGQAVTTAELRTAIGMPLYRLETQAHELMRQKLRQLISERLLAAEATRRKITLPQLLEEEVTRKVEAPDEATVDTFYQANKSRLPADEKTARAQARQLLLAQRQDQARQALLQRLESSASIVQHLPAPTPPRVELPPTGGISRGGEQAPVTIVVFTDFHCPFCKLAENTMAELRTKFGDKLRYEYRDFPIARLHPQAPRAHLAARCAAAQDKFWPYHDKLFAGPADAGTEQLLGYARDTALDVEAFSRCLDSNEYQAAIQSNIEAGSRLGVTGTPTFFVNGQMVVGAQPLSRFVEVIEQELTRQESANAKQAPPAAVPPPASRQGQR